MAVLTTSGSRLFYPYDSATQKFDQSPVVGSTPSSASSSDTLSFNAVTTGTAPDGTAYAVFVAPTSANGDLSGLYWYALLSAGTVSTVSAITTSSGNPYTAAAVIASNSSGNSSSTGLILAVMSNNSYEIYDPKTGSLLATSSSAASSVSEVLPYRLSGVLTNTWWSNDGGWVYQYTYNASTQSVVRGSFAPLRPGADASGNLSYGVNLAFSLDGSAAYYFGHEPDALLPVFIQINVTAGGGVGSQQEVYGYETTGRPGSNFAFANGFLYWSSGNQINTYALYGSGLGDIQNGTSGWSLGSVSSIASSPDDGTLYVGTPSSVYTFQKSDLTAENGAYVPLPNLTSPTLGSLVLPAGVVGISGTNLYDGSKGFQPVLAKYTLDASDVPQPTSTVSLSGVDPVLLGYTHTPADLEVSNGVLWMTRVNTYLNGNQNGPNDVTVWQTSLASSQSLYQGETVTQNLTGATLSAVSPNGRYQYAYSATDQALGLYDTKSQTWATFFDGTQLPFGSLTGVTSIVTSQDSNGVQYALLANAAGTLTTFSTTATDSTKNGVFTYSSASVATSPTTAGVGINAMYYVAGSSANKGTLYVLTSNALTSYSPVSDNLTSLGAATTVATGTNLTGLTYGNGKLYVIGDHGASIYAVGTDSTHWPYTLSASGGSNPAPAMVTGLSSVTALASYGGDLYAASSSGRLYFLVDSGSAITPQGTYLNSVNGVHGLSGASAVTLSPDGRYVFVAGTAENSVAAFIRNGDGSLAFAQDAVNGRAALGMAQPTGLYSYQVTSGSTNSTYLLVASGASVNGINGAFALLNVSPISSVQPIDVKTTFSNIGSLTLSGGSSGDSINVLAAPALENGTTAVPITINTGGGNDSVNIADTGPAGTVLRVIAGNGSDQVMVNQAVDRSANTGSSTLTISTGTGSDNITLNQLAPHVAASVSPGAGGVAVVQVNGVGIPSSSSVAVSGNLSAGSVQALPATR